jgi:hypothetical protein
VTVCRIGQCHVDNVWCNSSNKNVCWVFHAIRCTLFVTLQCMTSCYGSNLATSQSCSPISLCFFVWFQRKIRKFTEILGRCFMSSCCKDDHFRLNCFIPVCATRSFLKLAFVPRIWNRLSLTWFVVAFCSCFAQSLWS